MHWDPMSPTDSPSSGDNAGELLGLGQFESLPPFEMIEDLYVLLKQTNSPEMAIQADPHPCSHSTFFTSQQAYLPIIHPGNYLRSFHAPPHMRPPLSLQYALWTVAANGHPKYGSYHDALYRRARQYLEAEELKVGKCSLHC